jgi:hypothetical protein
MRTMLIALGLLVLCSPVLATRIAEKPLIDMVAESDHVLIGEIKAVDMVDGAGQEVTDLNGRTGLGYTNTIRLSVTVQRDGILKTNKADTPNMLTILLWKGWIATLADMQYLKGRTYIFLLRGEDYQIVYPLGSYQEISKRNEIEKIIRGKPMTSNAVMRQGERLTSSEAQGPVALDM